MERPSGGEVPSDELAARAPEDPEAEAGGGPPGPGGAGADHRRDRWDPDQYRRFQAERDLPFLDLLDLLEPIPAGGAVVDLGCGDGRLTALAHERLGAASTLGVDNSPSMLAGAPEGVDGLRFEHGDIGSWTAEPTFDVVVANASLQWVPDHRAVLARWAAALRPGGQVAVQLPANADHPPHVVVREVTAELGIAADDDPVAVNTLRPEDYAEVLVDLGAERQHVRLQVYAHRLASSAEVVEWVKGTTLTRIRRATDDDGYDRFLDAYRRRLLDIIGERSPYTYLFKRIHLWARMA